MSSPPTTIELLADIRDELRRSRHALYAAVLFLWVIASAGVFLAALSVFSSS